nr:YciI family protein [Stenotrophomonas sp. NLF4-10]
MAAFAFISGKESGPVWYVIEGRDGKQVLAARMQARAAHLERLQALLDAGRLLLAGPCPAIDAEDPGEAGFSGSVVIASFDDLAAARAWADADPYVAAGVYHRVDVRPFRKVLP